jgi:hypothetical protein
MPIMSIMHCWTRLVCNHPCLRVDSPHCLLPVSKCASVGAMYMLIRIDPSAFHDIEDDKDFFTKLVCEESISCLPASVKSLLPRKYSNHQLSLSCCRYLASITSFALCSPRHRRKRKKHANECWDSVDAMLSLSVDFFFF